jgi:hypothetical protein
LKGSVNLKSNRDATIREETHHRAALQFPFDASPPGEQSLQVHPRMLASSLSNQAARNVRNRFFKAFGVVTPEPASHLVKELPRFAD